MNVMNNPFERHRKHVEDMSKHQFYKKLQDDKRRKEEQARINNRIASAATRDFSEYRTPAGTTKSLGLTILLAILIPGAGHLYLGYVKRGISILIGAIALWFLLSMLIPLAFAFVVGAVYWIWQIVDAYRRYQDL